MEDIFFVILLVVCFLLLCFYLAYTEKREKYIKILAGIALLILVWVGGGDAAFGPKMMLTALAVSNIWKGYAEVKKNRKAIL